MTGELQIGPTSISCQLTETLTFASARLDPSSESAETSIGQNASTDDARYEMSKLLARNILRKRVLSSSLLPPLTTFPSARIRILSVDLSAIRRSLIYPRNHSAGVAFLHARGKKKRTFLSTLALRAFLSSSQTDFALGAGALSLARAPGPESAIQSSFPLDGGENLLLKSGLLPLFEDSLWEVSAQLGQPRWRPRRLLRRRRGPSCRRTRSSSPCTSSSAPPTKVRESRRSVRRMGELIFLRSAPLENEM